MPYRYGKGKPPLCAVVIINNKKYLCQNNIGEKGKMQHFMYTTIVTE